MINSTFIENIIIQIGSFGLQNLNLRRKNGENKQKKLIKFVILIIGVLVGLVLVKTINIPNTVNDFLGLETSNYYNIIDYGAESDRPSFDNADVFNEIIKDMGDEGGTIYIPPGNFFVDSSIEIDRSYISIIGNNSGLRSGVDDSNSKTQSGGGGAKIIARPGVTAIQIEDNDNPERISGVTFRSFQIRGQSNNGIGINGVQDTDRIVIDDLVINNVGTGVQLHGADAPSISNSWISETQSSIILSGASQQANIIGNSLGAQPEGSTIELENAQWFNISSNNIYPDGSSNIRLYNPVQGNISSNTITSRYNAIIELLPNNEEVYGHGNLINGNTISKNSTASNPDDKDKNWGIIHIEADNTNVTGNQLNIEGMLSNYTGIMVASGENNRISSNSIGVDNFSNSKVTISIDATNTIVTESIYEEEFNNEGDNTNINSALPH